MTNKLLAVLGLLVASGGCARPAPASLSTPASHEDATGTARSELNVTEVPSFEHMRRYGEGQLRTFPDGWRVLKTILAERGARRTPQREVREAGAAPAPRQALAAERGAPLALRDGAGDLSADHGQVASADGAGNGVSHLDDELLGEVAAASPRMRRRF